MIFRSIILSNLVLKDGKQWSFEEGNSQRTCTNDLHMYVRTYGAERVRSLQLLIFYCKIKGKWNLKRVVFRQSVHEDGERTSLNVPTRTQENSRVLRPLYKHSVFLNSPVLVVIVKSLHAYLGILVRSLWSTFVVSCMNLVKLFETTYYF